MFPQERVRRSLWGELCTRCQIKILFTGLFPVSELKYFYRQTNNYVKKCQYYCHFVWRISRLKINNKESIIYQQTFQLQWISSFGQTIYLHTFSLKILPFHWDWKKGKWVKFSTHKREWVCYCRFLIITCSPVLVCVDCFANVINIFEGTITVRDSLPKSPPLQTILFSWLHGVPIFPLQVWV